MGSFNCHRDFAEDYCKEILGIDNIDEKCKEYESDIYIRGAQDYLVYILGWISIGYSMLTGNVYTCTPDKKRITQIQKDIGFQLYQANEYDMKDYYFKFDAILPPEAYDDNGCIIW